MLSREKSRQAARPGPAALQSPPPQLYAPPHSSSSAPWSSLTSVHSASIAAVHSCVVRLPIWGVADSENSGLVTSSPIQAPPERPRAPGWCWCCPLSPGVSFCCRRLMFGLGEGLPYYASWASTGKGQGRPDQCVRSLPRSSSKVKKGVVTQGRLDWMMWAWKKVTAKKNTSSSRAGSEQCRSSSFSNPCLLISSP